MNPIQSAIFGKTEWEEYVGKIDEETSIPSTPLKILRQQCPIQKEAKVRDTHLLLLIPSSIDQKPVTLRLLQERFSSQSGKPGLIIHQGIDDSLLDWDLSPKEPYWALLSLHILPGTRWLTFKEQACWLDKKAKAVPPRLLELVAGIFFTYAYTEESIYGKSPTSTYSRCEERLLVGSFENGFLHIAPDDDSIDQYVGMAATSRFLAFS